MPMDDERSSQRRLTCSRLGVISDTHGHVFNTKRAADVFARCDVEAVLHCGDIGSPVIPGLLAQWPTHYVLGNVDMDGAALRDAIAAAGGTCHGRLGGLTIGERQVAWLHGDDQQQLSTLIRSGQWDLICFGHTHQASQIQQGKTMLLNPGALVRAWPKTVAVVDLLRWDVTRIAVEEA